MKSCEKRVIFTRKVYYLTLIITGDIMFKNLKILIIFGSVIFFSFQLFSQEDKTIVTNKETYLLPLENHFRISGNTLLFSVNMRIGDKIVIKNLN